MRYLSVCSGIEAASVAWEPLGWAPAGFSEIEPFPSAVLAHRFPNVKNYGDMTKFKEWKIEKGTVDVLVGGTPCQSFSTAGLRGGLNDPRGNLMLVFGAIVDHFRPQWLLWENVPGVLSSNKGRDFGAFLGMLAQLGYGFAYRILNAERWGIPQRRRRVFVVGHLGDWRRAAKVLFDSASLPGDTSAGGKRGKEASQGAAGRVEGKGGTICLMDQGGAVMQAMLDKVGTLRANPGGNKPIVFLPGCSWVNTHSDVSPVIGRVQQPAICHNRALRRMTPLECERAQGFPDNWTQIPWRGKPADKCPDYPRYRAVGNSMAVPVMEWLGKRIARIQTKGTKNDT